ncbi:MAG: phosphoglycerate mutase [Polaromonas sp.]
MPDPIPLRHLLIPGAGLPAAAGPGAAPHTQPNLPNLKQLLRHMAPSDLIECDEDSPSMPYELALARLNGLPAQPGLIPWAAFETGTTGTPCAWIKPCHWQMGADHVQLGDPASLGLDEAASRALLDAAAPYFRDDGMTLAYHLPDAWLASGEVFRHLSTRSLERVIGHRITPAVFDASSGGTALRRLQNEMQMLFYTHPVNDMRQRQGLLPVNSFWITGAGALDQPIAPARGVEVETRLHAPALQQDPQAHARAWQAVDADACARLLTQVRQGLAAQLTLCGQHRARSYRVAEPTLLRRLKHVFGLQPTSFGLEEL